MPLKKLTPLAKTLTSFFDRDSAILREALKAIQPEELAVIVNNLHEREQVQVLTLLDDAKLARVIWEVSPHTRQRLVGKLHLDRLLALTASLESDETADVIQLLDRRKRERMIEALRKADPKKVLPLLGFEEETAGGLMKSEILRVESGLTVDVARKTIAATGGGSKASAVYLTDAAGRLFGSVSMVRLATAQPEQRVDEIAHLAVEALPVALSEEDVVRRFGELDVTELPVIDAHSKLLGVITVDDVLDVLKDSLSEDLSRFSGTSEDEHISDPVWLSIRRRLPWLIVNLLTAILAAFVVTRFEHTIAELVILAALMPIVAGMGGNAVTQTLGVSIRAMALNQMQYADLSKIIYRQMLTGVANGLATGSIMALVVYIWTHDHKLALVLLAAMTVNLFIAGLGGVIIPVTLKRLKADPALASSVFATTMTDVVGFFTFLGLATLFLT